MMMAERPAPSDHGLSGLLPQSTCVMLGERDCPPKLLLCARPCPRPCFQRHPSPASPRPCPCRRPAAPRPVSCPLVPLEGPHIQASDLSFMALDNERPGDQLWLVLGGPGHGLLAHWGSGEQPSPSQSAGTLTTCLSMGTPGVPPPPTKGLSPAACTDGDPHLLGTAPARALPMGLVVLLPGQAGPLRPPQGRPQPVVPGPRDRQ